MWEKGERRRGNHEFSPATNEILSLWQECNEQTQRAIAQGEPLDGKLVQPCVERIVDLVYDLDPDEGYDPGVLIMELLMLVDMLSMAIINSQLNQMEQPRGDG